MCVLRQQRSCTCHNFRDCIAIKRPQHMRCDPTPVDASKSVHSGQMCSMLHSIPWKEGKQCRDLQLSKLCFCCMRHPKLLLLWLPTVCGVFITLCPVMGVFGPATGACRSWTPHLDRPFCVSPLLGLQWFDWKWLSFDIFFQFLSDFDTQLTRQSRSFIFDWTISQNNFFSHSLVISFKCASLKLILTEWFPVKSENREIAKIIYGPVKSAKVNFSNFSVSVKSENKNSSGSWKFFIFKSESFFPVIFSSHFSPNLTHFFTGFFTRENN